MVMIARSPCCGLEIAYDNWLKEHVMEREPSVKMP